MTYSTESDVGTYIQSKQANERYIDLGGVAGECLAKTQEVRVRFSWRDKFLHDLQNDPRKSTTSRQRVITCKASNDTIV